MNSLIKSTEVYDLGNPDETFRRYIRIDLADGIEATDVHFVTGCAGKVICIPFIHKPTTCLNRKG